jgi:hypothetical protein
MAVMVYRTRMSLVVLSATLALASLGAGASPDDQIMRDAGMLAGPWEGKSGDDLVGGGGFGLGLVYG